MLSKLHYILVNFVLSLKDGLVEPFRNLFLDIKYDLFTKDGVFNVEDLDNVEEVKPEEAKPKKKGKKKKLK